MRLQRDAPVGRNAAELTGRTERIGTERVLLAEAERLVAGEFQIKQVVDEGVGADAADMRGKCALDRRRMALWAKDRRYGVREGPCRRGVPHILHGRIVVGRDAVDQVERAEMGRVGIADVGIVPRPGMTERIAKASGRYRVVGDLREGADIVGDRSARRTR